MFDISPEKVVIVLIIALVVLGPGRLAESARALGRARAQLRQWSSALPPDTAKLVRNPRGALLDALADPPRVVAPEAEAARRTVSATTEPEPEPEEAKS